MLGRLATSPTFPTETTPAPDPRPIWSAPVSIALLIDGYNVIAPVAGPGRGPNRGADPASLRWLQTERQRLLDRLVENLSHIVRTRTCVIFDAKNAPRDLPSRTVHHDMDVWFAVDYPEADDLLEELIRTHHHPKQLTVVSSDHRVQAAAKRRKSKFYDSDPWYDDLIDGHVRLGWRPKPKSSRLIVNPPVPPKLTDLASDDSSPVRRSPIVPGSTRSDISITDDDLQRWLDASSPDPPNDPM